MPLGTVTEIIRDGGLGIAPSSAANAQLTIGVSSLGTANTLYGLSTSDTISSTLGLGPLADAMALKVALGGGPQYAIPINASVAGVSGAVTPTRVGSSTGTVTTATAPNDAYQPVITIVSAGVGQLVTGGTVQVTISYDNGLSTGAAILVPAGGTLVLTGTGITLTFSVSATTFDKGDVFKFTCQAPFYASADLTAAVTPWLGDPRQFTIIHVVGFPTAGNSAANATASAAIAVTCDTLATAFFNAGKYVRFVLDTPPSADADLITAFTSYSSTRVFTGSSTGVVNSALNGRKLTRAWAWAIASRMAQPFCTPSVSPGRVSDGNMQGWISITRNEASTPGLFDARFGVATTIIGKNGFFSDIGKTFAPNGSDFSIIPNCRVIDIVSNAARIAATQFLNSSVRVNATTGLILEADAQGIERYITSIVNAAAQSEYSALTVTLDRTVNVLSTQQLLVKIRVTPLGYATSIVLDIGLQNPLLALS